MLRLRSAWTYLPKMCAIFCINLANKISYDEKDQTDLIFDITYNEKSVFIAVIFKQRKTDIIQTKFKDGIV